MLYLFQTKSKTNLMEGRNCSSSESILYVSGDEGRLSFGFFGLEEEAGDEYERSIVMSKSTDGDEDDEDDDDDEDDEDDEDVEEQEEQELDGLSSIERRLLSSSS